MSNVYRARREAWEERNREMLAARLISDCFPGVSSIVVTMNYTGGRASTVHRTMSYHPGSHAFFKISSLGEERDADGIDLTYFIHRMVRSGERLAKGEYCRRHEDPAIVDQSVDYQVAITYS